MRIFSSKTFEFNGEISALIDETTHFESQSLEA